MIALQDEQAPAKLDPRELPHRYDAFAKVTGRAKYAAEFPPKRRLRLHRSGGHPLGHYRLHRSGRSRPRLRSLRRHHALQRA